MRSIRHTKDTSDERRATSDERRILITAGPTREYLDPVRYITNHSSGKMGFALAKEAARWGFKVDLIAGPVELPTPNGVHRTNVVSALEMRSEVLKRSKGADVIIMVAAVADWRPVKMSPKKIKRSSRVHKRTNVRTYERTIALKENPDIIAEIGSKKKPGQIIVAFALETDHLERNALKKMSQKKCDWIVANEPAAVGAESSRAILFCRDGRRIPLSTAPKEELSCEILSNILADQK